LLGIIKNNRSNIVMENYFYFICLESNIALLREEIKLFAPELKPSFSKKNFLTYKASQLPDYDFAFALEWGLNNDVSQESIENKLKCTQSEKIPEGAPSRAYLKIAEACQKYEINDPSLHWIEFGSAPGGASYYLCQNFHQVTGVDPAEMSPIVLNHEKFLHIKKPIQNLRPSDFDFKGYQFITSDLNLNPKQAIKEVLRCSQFFRSIQGIFMTVKIVKKDHVKHIPKFCQSFRNAGFKHIQKCQLPSHKQEFLIYASKQ
tara:strand:+ start:10287 stop:11066 length:780 start_codon:yes stop_codon:yes gene_type:complete